MENQKLLQDFPCGGFSSTTTSAVNHHNSSTMKRKSPPSSLPESFSKKSNNLHGFKVLPLPIMFPSPSSASGLHLTNSSPESTDSDTFPAKVSSPNLKKIKELIRGLNQLMPEEEEEVHSEYDDQSNLEEAEINGGGNEETVSVEKCGNRVSIQFNCPCGKSHRNLQSGNNCYYNLI